MKSEKIAVASTDGKQVNEHFGRSELFKIYEKGPELTFVEDRTCTKLSTGDPGHAFDLSRFDPIADMLQDCKSIYVSDIGAVPEAELKKRGLEVVRCNCPIDQIAGCGGKCRSS